LRVLRTEKSLFCYYVYLILIVPSLFFPFSVSLRFPPLHSDPECLEIATLVMGHSLVRSLVRSHRSLVRLLRTARFARALRCAHSFARSLAHSLPSSWDSGIFLSYFQSVLDHCALKKDLLTERCPKKLPRSGFSSFPSCRLFSPH